MLPRADAGAWSPARSQPEEDDSQVSSTSQGPGNSKAPEAIWASVRTLSKYEEKETYLQKACQPQSRTIKITGEKSLPFLRAVMEPQGEVWWQERDRPESRFYRRGCNPALMGVRVGENELGGNQKWVGGAQRGMSPVTSEAPFTATMDTSPASQTA